MCLYCVHRSRRRRRRLTVRPPQPSEEDVNKYHAMYMDGLKDLFERNDPMGGLKIR